MVRLAISVEGATEERFVNKMLIPHLQDRQVYATPLLLGRSGGGVSLARVVRDLNLLANSFDKVTTLYDFYGFKGKSGNETKTSLEEKIHDHVTRPLQGKIIPYIQMHEFEALLFSCPEAMEDTIQQDGVREWAQGVLRQFNHKPEEINDSAQTAPSKRLRHRFDYIKTAHGPGIAEVAGLDALREKCVGFNAWLRKLEGLPHETAL